MIDKTKKIEVYTGCSSGDNYPINFKSQIYLIFTEIAAFRQNGGCMYPITGDFMNKTDQEAFKMEFYCTQSDFSAVINKIKEEFRKIQPDGVEFVSIKAHDVESFSFSVKEYE